LINNQENIEGILNSMIEDLIVKQDDPEGGSIYQCTACGKCLKRKQKMKEHAESHVEGFSHECRFCGRIYKTRPSLGVHISTVHKHDKIMSDWSHMSL
jgi:uncharacterized C2H2 Zn-finger protein